MVVALNTFGSIVTIIGFVFLPFLNIADVKGFEVYLRAPTLEWWHITVIAMPFAVIFALLTNYEQRRLFSVIAALTALPALFGLLGYYTSLSAFKIGVIELIAPDIGYWVTGLGLLAILIGAAYHIFTSQEDHYEDEEEEV